MLDHDLRLQQENLAYEWQCQRIREKGCRPQRVRWKDLDTFFSTEEKRIALFHGTDMKTAIAVVIYPDRWCYFLLENFSQLMETPENRGILQVWLNNGMYEHRQASGYSEDGMYEYELSLYTA